MVQPCERERRPGLRTRSTGIGCVGRITTFSETEDGRYLITLNGPDPLRHPPSELPSDRGYRRVVPRLRERFRDDLERGQGVARASTARATLLAALRAYFEVQSGLDGDWDAIEKTPDERLVTSLAMVCPFDPPEKQALAGSRHPAGAGRDHDHHIPHVWHTIPTANRPAPLGTALKRGHQP